MGEVALIVEKPLATTERRPMTNKTIWWRRAGYAVLLMCPMIVGNEIGQMLVGIYIAIISRFLWDTRTFTISIDSDGKLSTTCELCQDTEVGLSGANLRTTLGFAYSHSRQHITHKI